MLSVWFSITNIRKIILFLGFYRNYFKAKHTPCLSRIGVNSRAYKSRRREEQVQRTEVYEQEKKVKDLIDKPYLSIAEAGRLLGISRHTIYRYIYSGRLRAYNMSSQRSIVKHEDIEQMLGERPYEKRQPRDAIVITELYTTDEVCDTYDISCAALFAIAVESTSKCKITIFFCRTHFWAFQN